MTAERRVLLVVWLLILAGCAARGPGPAVPVDWESRRAALLGLDAWEARGRIALRAARGGGQGDLDWSQAGESALIRVSGPFGAGAYEIRWDPATLSIASRDGKVVRDYAGRDSAERFLAEQLGWAFPATSIRYWLRGLADPAFPAAEIFAADGQPLSIGQNGWMISFDRFAPGPAWPMPTRLTLERGDARLRVVVDRWCLDDGCLADREP